MTPDTQSPTSWLSEEELKAFLAWWYALSSEAAEGQYKADRAVLRRCDTPYAVACTAAFHRALAAIQSGGNRTEWSVHLRDRLAALVGLAAHIKKADTASLAQRMGRKDDPQGRPLVSELRFKRLLDSPDLDSLTSSVRRALPLVEHQLNVGKLARDFLSWNDKARKAWAYDYFAPVRGAPATADPANVVPTAG